MMLLGIEAERIRKLRLVSLKIDGKSIVVSGPPDKGKTTLINLLWMAAVAKYCGDDVIQKGESNAFITAYLGEPGSGYEVKITRTFSGDNSRLKVEAADGKVLGADFAKDLIESLSFDPLDFLRQKGMDQIAMLLSVSNVPVEKLRELEVARETTYNLRTDAKRELKRWENILGEKPEEVQRIDITELTDNMAKIKVHNDKYDNADRTLKSLAETKEALERDIAELQTKLDETNSRIQKGTQIMSKLERLDEKEPLEKLRNIQAINIKAEKWETYQKNSVAKTDALKEVAALEQKIYDIDDERKDILSEAQWPVEGMMVRDGEIYINDILLKNCGDAQKMQVSFAIAMSQNPTLRCCRMDGGESLGKEGRTQLLEMAEGNGYQVLMSRVSDNGAEKGEIEIVEGEVQ